MTSLPVCSAVCYIILVAKQWLVGRELRGIYFMGIELSSSKVDVVLYHCFIYCYNTKFWFLRHSKCSGGSSYGNSFFTMSSTKALPNLDVLPKLFRSLCLFVGSGMLEWLSS
jgi:hypothetical protein